MNKEEHEIHKKLCCCRICENRQEFDDELITCSLTGRFAQFKETCPNFTIDQERFLLLEKTAFIDIEKTDRIERSNRNYSSEKESISYNYIKFKHSIQNVKLPDEYVIKAPVFKNVVISFPLSFLFFMFLYSGFNSVEINDVLKITLPGIISILAGYFLYKQLLSGISEIRLNKEGIFFKGKESAKYKWNEVLFFFIKECYRPSKGGGNNRYFKLNFVSGFSELIYAVEFLTYSKSNELLEWTHLYHQYYWNQHIDNYNKISYGESSPKKERKTYSITRISNRNSLYQQELKLLKESLPYSMDWHDVGWEKAHEKSWHFIAIQDSEVIACAVLLPNEKDKSAKLIHFVVIVDWRKKGIGTKLLNELFTFSKYKRIQEISCESLPEICTFLEKRDFKKYDESYDDGGLLRISMKCKI